MTVFDYAVMAVIGMSILFGLWRGVVGEILAIIAWIVAFLAARAISVQIAELLVTTIDSPGARLLVAWVLVFVVVLVLFAIGRKLVSLLLKAVGLGMLDRLLGGCFGALRGLLVVLIAVMLAGMTPLPSAAWWRGAILAPPLETVVIAAKPWMPQDVAKRIGYR
jgi:membrane protein required for colicin V production